MVVAVVLVLALAGAGAFLVTRPDESAKVAAAARDPRSPEQIWNDTVTAQSVQLTLADFPEGWHTEPRSQKTHDAIEQDAIQTFGSCMGDPLAAVATGDAESPGTAKSDKFVADSGSLQAEGDVHLEPSVEAAEAEFVVLRRPQFARCLGDLLNAAFRHAVDNPAPGEALPAGVSFGDASVTTIELPGSHADAIGVHGTVPISGPRGSITEVFDFVFARKARTGLTLSLFNVGDAFPTDMAVQLLNAMADRAPNT